MNKYRMHLNRAQPDVHLLRMLAVMFTLEAAV